jgi:alkylation response protein AidB-like acyl-CoA dehydrogenase
MYGRALRARPAPASNGRFQDARGVTMQDFPAIDFHHGDTIDMLRATVRQFAADEIAPRAAEIDRANEFPAGPLAQDGRPGHSGHHRRRRIRAARPWAISRT